MNQQSSPMTRLAPETLICKSGHHTFSGWRLAVRDAGSLRLCRLSSLEGGQFIPSEFAVGVGGAKVSLEYSGGLGEQGLGFLIPTQTDLGRGEIIIAGGRDRMVLAKACLADLQGAGLQALGLPIAGLIEEVAAKPLKGSGQMGMILAKNAAGRPRWP